MKTVAGIDLGTQSLKVVLYDFEAKKIAASASCPIELISENDGSREQKTAWYDEALKKCFADIPADVRKTVTAAGVSGQQHGFVPLDADGEPLYNVKLWNDTSTAEECALLTQALGGEKNVIAEVCNLMLSGFTAPKILWLKRHKSEAFTRLAYVLLPHDYINFKLTGTYAMEAGDASGTALFNAKKREWSHKACAAVDPKLFSLLPRIIESSTPCGYVTATAAKEFGIPAGIPVASGGGDNMMSAIGTGTVVDGFLTVSMGTSGTLYGYSAKSIANPENGLSGFCSSSGGWLPLLCTMNCTVASEKLRDLFGLSVKEFDAEAAGSPIGAESVVVLPFFNGERTPNLPNGRASIMGLTAANSSLKNICRAALESAVFALRGGLAPFSALGFSASEIRLTGGGAKSAIWRQIVADVFNLPVKIPLNTEAAAFGAALQALWCFEKAKGNPDSGIADICAEHVLLDGTAVLPIPENVKKYEAAYAAYLRYLHAVEPLYI